MAALLDLIRSWLEADILHGLERWTPAEGPSPQGAVISPLLANIYLDPLDRLMAEHGYPMVRYADDFVILTRSHAEAEAALALVRAWVAENGLTLTAPEKTRIANCRKKRTALSSSAIGSNAAAVTCARRASTSSRRRSGRRRGAPEGRA
ncbi:MAG: reverse transcriptase domain-containing protein [Xanthobacteraceae bacterium]|nr:reverse transcriptase domain-containing protein [Xanthobacteraceae bacterium]